jgi:hypothetical protein
MRLCRRAHSAFGVVVMMAKLRIHSPFRRLPVLPQAGKGHQARVGSASAIAYGCLPVPVFAHS